MHLFVHFHCFTQYKTDLHGFTLTQNVINFIMGFTFTQNPKPFTCTTLAISK